MSIALLPGVGIISEICLMLHSLIRIIHHLMCYQTIRQVAKKLLLKGGEFIQYGWLIGVSTLHAHAQSPNLTIKTLISSVMHVM